MTKKLPKKISSFLEELSLGFEDSLAFNLALKELKDKILNVLEMAGCDLGYIDFSLSITSNNNVELKFKNLYTVLVFHGIRENPETIPKVGTYVTSIGTFGFEKGIAYFRRIPPLETLDIKVCRSGHEDKKNGPSGISNIPRIF